MRLLIEAVQAQSAKLDPITGDIEVYSLKSLKGEVSPASQNMETIPIRLLNQHLIDLPPYVLLT